MTRGARRLSRERAIILARRAGSNMFALLAARPPRAVVGRGGSPTFMFALLAAGSPRAVVGRGGSRPSLSSRPMLLDTF